MNEADCTTLPNDFVELRLILAGHNLGESMFIMDSMRACKVSMDDANRFDTSLTFHLWPFEPKSLTATHNG